MEQKESRKSKRETVTTFVLSWRTAVLIHTIANGGITH
jgi:hypothetical protein